MFAAERLTIRYPYDRTTQSDPRMMNVSASCNVACNRTRALSNCVIVEAISSDRLNCTATATVVLSQRFEVPRPAKRQATVATPD